MATFNYRFAAASKASESNTEYGIIADLSFGDTRIRISTGIKIKFKHFNPEYGGNLEKIVRPTITQEGINRAQKIHEFKTVNQRLSQGLDLYLNGQLPQYNNAKEALERFLVTGKIQHKNLIEKFDEFVKFKSKGSLEDRTKSAHARVEKIIHEIVRVNPTVNFDAFDLSEDFFFAYLNYAKEQNWISSTYNKYLKGIKTFMNWLPTKYPQKTINQYYKSVKDFPEPENIFFLTVDEIQAFREHKFGLIGQQREQDMFLFQMSIGRRDSDIQPLAKSLKYFDLEKNRLKIKNQKGKQVIDLSLPEMAMEIFEKYKDQGKFPLATNQKRNEHLKEMFKILEMNRVILISNFYVRENKIEITESRVCDEVSTHWARSTFITQLTNQNIHNHVISLYTGQSDKTIRKYQGKDFETMETVNKEQINKLFNK